MEALADWDSFYLIVGSAAGGLIGLQFVVMTLLAARPPSDGVNTGAAFATPTIVHFTVALVLSAITRVPWHSVQSLRAVCLVGGAAGVAYMAAVARRMRRQKGYLPEFEDWLFHLLLPLDAYLMLFAIAAMIGAHATAALILLAGTTLLLLLVGIHNAWDAVSYHVLVQRPRDGRSR